MIRGGSFTQVILGFLCCIAFFFESQNAQGSHIMGSDIEWQCVGEDSFEVTLSLYRDCSGSDIFFAPSINISRCNPTDTTLLSYTQEDITQVCGDTCTQCSSAPCGYGFGVERHSATYLVDLSGQNCSEIYFSKGLCCRSGNLTTVQDTTDPNAYLYYADAYLNLQLAPCNNSPQFDAPPTPIFCDSQQVFYSQAITSNDTNASGELLDSTVFEWAYPLEGYNYDTVPRDTVDFDSTFAYNDPITWKGKHSGKNKDDSMPYGLHLDSTTGDLKFTPVNAGEQSIFALKVSEYRNDTLVAYTRRDLQVIITDCPDNNVPSLTGFNGTNKVFDEIPVGSSASYDIYSNDPDNPGKGDTVTMEFRRQSLPNSASWSDNSGDTLMASGTLDWTPQSKHAGQTFQFSLKAKDDFCPQNGWSSKTYSIKVCDTLKPSSPNLRKTSVYNSDSIQVIWDKSNDNRVNKYELFYAKKGYSSFQSAGIVKETNTQPNDFFHKAIDPHSQSYCYYLKAIDSCSGVHSLPSDTHCIMQLEAKGGQRENHLYWEPYKGPAVDSYTVERKDGGTWMPIATIDGTDTSFTDTNNARCNIPYQYRIEAEWTDGQTFTSLSDTGRAKPFDTVNPSAPQIEALSIQGPNSAKLTWQLSDGDVTQYELWLKTKNGGWQNKDTVGVQTSYTFGGLNTPDSIYCAKLLAIDSCAANRSGFSASHCAMQLETSGGQKENYLNWHAYDGWSMIDEYFIYNKNVVNSNWQIIDTVPGSDTSYTHNGIPCNRSQHYRIQGKSVTGDTAFSDSSLQTPFDTVAPDVPAINHATVNGPTSIRLNFDTADALDMGNYAVYGSANGNPYQLLGSVSDTGQAENDFIHNNIRADTGRYCYYVEARDSCASNVSKKSNVHCPVELQGTAGNVENFLQWRPYQGFSNPTYYIQKANNNNWKTLASLTDTNYTDSNNLACHVTETYRVMTISPSKTDTSFSDTVNLTPYDTVAPPTPQLRFASVGTNDDVALEWNWNRNTDQKYFEIWGDQGNGNFQLLDTIIYDSTYTDNIASPLQNQHGYYVIATDSCAAQNRAAPSDTDRILVPEATTGACQPEIRLNWNSYNNLPQGTDYYEIHRKVQGSSNNFASIQESAKTSFTDSLISDDTTYCYRIRAIDSQSGYASWSDSLCQEPFVYPPPDSTNLTRTSIYKTHKNNGKTTLDWKQYNSKDTFARGYRIYHRNNNTNFQQIADIGNLNQTTYGHGSLNTRDFNHHYYITVYNLCDVEGPSTDTHRSINLNINNLNLATGIQWTPYKGFKVQDYEIYRSKDGGTYKVIHTTNDTGYVDTNIHCGHQYEYEIRALSSTGNVVSWSDSLSVTGKDTIPPDRADINKASVTQTSASNGAIELEFNGANQPNRKGYILYKATANSSFVPIDTIQTRQQQNITYSDEDFNTKTNAYGYYLRSFDSCDNIAMPSDTHQTIFLKVTPKNGFNQVSWRAYKGWDQHSYEIQRKQGNNAWKTLTTKDSGQLSYRDSNVTCHLIYDYRILGKEPNTSFRSFSNIDTAKAYEITPPIPPEPGRASVSKTGKNNGRIDLNWYSSTSKDADQYVVFHSRDGQNYQFLDTVQDTTYTDSSLNTYDESYHYRLKAIDSCGNISDSFSTVHRTINLTAKGVNEAIEITWNVYEGRPIKSYEILKNGQVLHSTGAQTTRFRDNKVVCDSFYNYQIRANLAGEHMSYSNTDSAQPIDRNPPKPVYLERASIDRFNDVVELKWGKTLAYDANGYVVYRNVLGPGGNTKIGEIRDPEETTFYDTFNVADQGVCYRVRAFDHCNNTSELSNRGCIIRPNGTPLELRNQLSWEDYELWNDGVEKYEIYKQMADSSFYQQIGEQQAAQNQFIDEDLASASQEFCYYIRAKGKNDEEYSNSTRICIQQPPVVHIPNSFSPGISDETNDLFGIEGLYIDTYTMQIFNRWGEKIYETTKGEAWNGKYQGELVPEGVYLYQISVSGVDGSTETFKGSLMVIR